MSAAIRGAVVASVAAAAVTSRRGVGGGERWRDEVLGGASGEREKSLRVGMAAASGGVARRLVVVLYAVPEYATSDS